MNWPTADMMASVGPPGAGYRYEVLRKETVPELIAALGAWESNWSVGAASIFLRESYYDSSVFLEGGPQQNVFTMLIRHGDELAGMLPQEQVVDALSLYASLVVIAPAHRGGKALFAGDYLGSNHMRIHSSVCRALDPQVTIFVKGAKAPLKLRFFGVIYSKACGGHRVP